MQALANLNGETLLLSEVRISPLDRGFLFGDAVYEVLRVYAGRPWLLDEHLARLGRSLEAIRIRGVDLAQLRQRLLDTVAVGLFQDALAYVQVTRGAGPVRSHAFPEETTPLELLWVEPFHDRYGGQREHGGAAITFKDLRWGRCDIKSTNLLGNVLAAQAAKEAGVGEALLYLEDDTLHEGCRTNLFAVLDGVMRTAPNSPGILPGVTREYVLSLARAQELPIREEGIRRPDLARVSEVFITGTTSEVLPLVRVDHQVIGSGKPGPVARRLQEAYQAGVRRWLGKA